MKFQKRKETLYKLILLAVVAVTVIFLTAVFVRHLDYCSKQIIRLTGIEKKVFSMDIRAEPIGAVPAGEFRAFPLLDQSGKNFVLHWSQENNELYITITHWEFGGWIVMYGTYQIPDSDQRQRLLVFLKENFT